jgi:hypothetical protein
VTPWWPWADDRQEPAKPPADEPALLDDRLQLTELGELEVLRGRIRRAQMVLGEAMRTHGNGWVPPDVLLDIKLALNPVTLRPEVPVIPGPDGAGHG